MYAFLCVCMHTCAYGCFIDNNVVSFIARVSSSISLNAAVFGAVCLSSRLSSTMHVFALMLSAVWLFAVFPTIRGKLKVRKALLAFTYVGVFVLSF